jgi:hypothetical protein
VTVNVDEIKKGLEELSHLTDLEDRLIAGAETRDMAQANLARVLTDLYLARQLRTAVDNLIQSNERLAEASDRQANWILGLTIALAVFAAVEASGVLVQADVISLCP